MKVKYIGEKTYGLTIGKEYTVISIDDGDYHIHEDDGREWTYPHEDFEITEPDNGETPKLFYVMDDRGY